MALKLSKETREYLKKLDQNSLDSYSRNTKLIIAKLKSFGYTINHCGTVEKANHFHFSKIKNGQQLWLVVKDLKNSVKMGNSTFNDINFTLVIWLTWMSTELKQAVKRAEKILLNLKGK